MFPTIHTVVRSSFSRDDGLLPPGCSSPLLSSKSTVSLKEISSSISTAFSNNVDSLRRGGAQLYEQLFPKAASEMSSQDHSQPFGYEFHEYTEPSNLPPPNSAPLLNMSESDFLTSFWQTQTQNHVDPGFTALSQLENQNTSNDYGWVLHEPPPTVRDIAAVSIPQTPVQQQAHGISPHIGMSEISQSLTNDGTMEAATLLSQQHQNHHSMRQRQNNSVMSPPYQIQRSQTQPIQSHRVYQSPVIQHVPGSAADLPASTSSGIIQAIHTQDALTDINSSAAAEMESLQASAHAHMLSALPQLQQLPHINTANMSAIGYSAPHSAPVSERFDQPTNPRLYHFGSDNNFNPNGFQPSSDFERHEYRAELLSSELRRLKPINRTPVGTRDPSPEAAPNKRKRPVSDGSVIIKDEHTGSAHKRKRSDVSEESEDQDGESSSKAGRNGSRTNRDKRQRRSSAPGSARPKRENLSDQQKRQNHIASEQKRRAQIKNGFDELNRLVPELRESGLSKSGMLIESCNFLEQLKKQNNLLSQRLGLPSID